MTALSHLRNRMTPCVELRFPCFEKHYEISSSKTKAYAFEPIDGRDWYNEFRQHIYDAIEAHRFLPIYRMFDGEYLFALGRSCKELSPFSRLSPSRLAQSLRQFIRVQHRSGSIEYGYESYGPAELNIAKLIFVEQLKRVAEKGILALALHETPLSRPYVPAILDWFDANQIPVHRNNYYHFYGLYALMHGPDRYSLLRDRRVLVATGLTPEKKQGIAGGLRRVGAADVQYLPVSTSKSMLDCLELSAVVPPVDIVLVGAGVGAVNVLSQLEPLQAVCLDVGFALSTLVNPDLRWNRPFCVPDDEFDVKRVRWLKG